MELTIRNVSRTFADGVRALINAGLTIRPGRYGLPGSGGGGKWALMRIPATRQQPGEGQIPPGEAAVILPAHAGEDAAERCMAVIDRGEILRETRPSLAVAALRGRIWRRVIETGSLPALAREHAVISTQTLGEHTLVRIYSDELPGKGFESVEPDLADVCFSTMAG